MNDWPAFIWPQDPDPDPGGVNRFGRVLHWLATGIAALCAGAAIMSYLSERGSTSEYGPDYGAAIVAAGFAAFFFFAGRAARYILSGE